MTSRPSDEAIMGLYTWAPKDESRSGVGVDPSRAVDIIAVQGLGASPYYTWVKKIAKAGGGPEEVMWLRDLLPKFVPNARIATFSYYSNWYTYKKGAKTSIRELGEQLLTVLHGDRQKVQAFRRPIVFLGHSMGGLVIKQALVHASNRPDCEDIRISTAGVVFLGTPHEGTEVAGWGEYLAMIRGNDRNLMRQLEPKATELYDLSHDFASGYKHLGIVCFYEKLDNAYFGGKLRVPIVDQRSAVQVGEGMMYLVADHSGLNKFSGDEDPNFKLVLNVIVGMVDKATARKVPHLQNSQFMVSRQPNPLFTGRKDELDKLKKALSPSVPRDDDNTEANIYVLYGMGGAGKSEVALKFVFKHRPEFWGIFWIDARSEASIATSFANVARRCGLDESINSAVSWLQETLQPWLLVLDNADDPNISLSPYLPAGINGSILITSRLPESARKYSNAGNDHYERLDEETAVELFLKSCSIDLMLRSDNEDHAHVIVDLLGCHALAVIQAGATVSHGICMLEEYRSMFLTQRRVLLETSPDQVNSVYGGVYTTFEISARYLGERSDQVARDALQLLNFHAFMHFSDFPEQAFKDAWMNSRDEMLVVSHLQPSDEKIYQLDPWHRSNLPTFMRPNPDNKELDIIALRNARATLASLSLITIDTSKGMTRIHPVTHAWAKDRLKEPESVKAWLNALAMLSLSFELHQYQPSSRLLEPHLEAVVTRPAYSNACKDIFGVQQSFFRLAWALYNLRNRSAAYEMLQMIVGKPSESSITTINGQEIQLLRAKIIGMRDLREAMVLLEQIAEAKAGSSEIDDDLHMNVQQHLGRYYGRLGQVTEAVEILERLVESKARKVDDVDDRCLLDYKYELAGAYYEVEDLQNARTVLEQVVQTERRTLEADHPSRLSAEHQLARVYMRLGDTTQATKIFEQVTQIKSKLLKPNDPYRLRSEQLLAICYCDSGRYEESLRLAESIQGLVRDRPGEPLADRNTKLIRRCLEAKKLEISSNGFENLHGVGDGNSARDQEEDKAMDGEDGGDEGELLRPTKSRCHKVC